MLDVRRRLDAAGARNVTIAVSGRLSPERIRTLLDNAAPTDVFHDTGAASAEPALAPCKGGGEPIYSHPAWVSLVRFSLGLRK